MRDSDLDGMRDEARRAVANPSSVGLVSPGVPQEKYLALAEAFLSLDRMDTVPVTMEQLCPEIDRQLTGEAAMAAEHLRMTLRDTGYPLPCCHRALDCLVDLAVKEQAADAAAGNIEEVRT